MTILAASTTRTPGNIGPTGALDVYLSTGNTGVIPRLAEVTMRLPRRSDLGPVTNLPGGSRLCINEHGFWMHYVKKELRAILYIESALTALTAYLLAVAPGPLLSAPGLWLMGALAAWQATAWMGIRPPNTRRALWCRRVAMVIGWLAGLMMLLAGIVIPIGAWLSSLLIA